ncbi:FtsH protease activity modulator HflK [Avibacterium sp. 21-586]|uniref:FtsH protease activity modulator HflK n=1 Tax=Avibacterium sp. 21-586 TaxID=2911534 RepID=UPI0022460035|nr:FtsH protease activity modulator HflK [Avibacterium sp. 21-586]MCW9710514.1 FtsH protease activity modulator HflK [Avibacterium sp. 21-586]
MSFNGSEQDPWGKPGSNPNQSDNKSDPNNQWDKRNKQEQSPPDLEEVFSNLLKKLGGGQNGGNHNGGSKGLSFGLGKLLPIAALIGAIVWGVSGFYTVKEAERGVVLRFGELEKIVQPGLNWKPTFVDKVIPVNVEQVKELKTQGAMLTRDENMVKVEMTVQYRVSDPAKYLFSVTNADDSLNQATDSALRYVIGHMSMDDILTTGRSIVREDTWKALNGIIQPYDMGLEVLDVNFQSARPPEEVKAAFDDAIKAQEDEQRYIREAEAYAREQEPIARGNAQRIIEEATAYKDQVVLNAQGEVERFQRLLPEFKAAPQLLRDRLYIQTMEKVMANTPKVLLDGNGNNLSVLPLDKILSPKNSEKSTAPNPTNAQSAVKNQDSYSDTRSFSSSENYPQSSENRQGRFN